MTLPGWVGVREPRGRLGGRYAKNVTICPTQACTKPLDWMGRDPRPLARRLAPPPPPHGGCRVSRSSTVAVTDESARGGEGERRDTALSHDLRVRWGSARARGYMSGYFLPLTGNSRSRRTVRHTVRRPPRTFDSTLKASPTPVSGADRHRFYRNFPKKTSIHIDIARFGKPTLSSKAQFHTNRETYNPLDQWCMTRPRAAS